MSINEILSGRRLSEEAYKEAAEQNLTQAIRVSSFSLHDKIVFYKKKWLKEHIAVMCFLGVGILVSDFFFGKPLLIYASILLLTFAHGWRNNAMMTYVEQNAYDGTG